MPLRLQLQRLPGSIMNGLDSIYTFTSLSDYKGLRRAGSGSIAGTSSRPWCVRG